MENQRSCSAPPLLQNSPPKCPPHPPPPSPQPVSSTSASASASASGSASPASSPRSPAISSPSAAETVPFISKSSSGRRWRRTAGSSSFPVLSRRESFLLDISHAAKEMYLLTRLTLTLLRYLGGR